MRSKTDSWTRWTTGDFHENVQDKLKCNLSFSEIRINVPKVLASHYHLPPMFYLVRKFNR